MTDDALLMFFEDDFVPQSFVDSLFKASVPHNERNSHFTDAKSLEKLHNQCSALLNAFDYYNGQLTRQFDDRMQQLNDSSSVISYEDSKDAITRLEYYIENLSSSLTSTANDLKDSIVKVQGLTKESRYQKTDEAVKQLQKMMEIKRRIHKVIEVFDTVRSLVASGNVDDNTESIVASAPTGAEPQDEELKLNENASDLRFDADSFDSILSLLKELILEQVSAEKRRVRSDSSAKPKKDFVAIIQGMIDLLPFFKSMNHFYERYGEFVEFLEKEKERYERLYG